MELDHNPTVDVTTSVSEQHNDDDIQMEDYTQLDFDLITYALNANLIVFITNPKNWLGFHTANEQNAHKYFDYTPDQLRRRFLEHVLPNIESYELTEYEEHLLSLLELNPSFSRTEEGFKPIEPFESIILTQDDAIIQRIVANYCREDSNENAINTDSANDQIVVSAIEQEDCVAKFQLNEENAALLLVTLCLKKDLLNYELMPISELQNRLKAAKQQFENCGELPENIVISIDDLLVKLKKLSDMEGTVMQSIDQHLGV